MEVGSSGLGDLHHVEMNVSNLERSVEFWSWLLGLLGYRPFQEWAEGRSFAKGHTYLVFVQTEEKYLDLPYHRRRAGLNHLAFHAETPDQVDEIGERLRSRGTPMLYEDRFPHAGGPQSYAVFFEDPDRIKVEITAKSTR